MVKVSVCIARAAHTLRRGRPVLQKPAHLLRATTPEGSLRECRGRLRRRPTVLNPGPRLRSYSGRTGCLPKGRRSAAFDLQDYNPHGLALMLVYKHGSTHGGIDGYGCPELSWLGLVASDVLEPLPRSLFTGSRADAERTLPSM